MNNSDNSPAVMQRDFKSDLEPTPTPFRRPKAHHVLGVVASLSLFGAIFFLITDSAKATRNDPLPATEQTDAALMQEELTRITVPLSLPAQGGNEASAVTETPPQSSPEQSLSWRTETVKKGDSLALIFSRLGLSPQELDRAMRAGKAAKRLKYLLPGQTLKFATDAGGLQQLVYQIDPLNTLKVMRDGDDSFHAVTSTRELENRVANAAGTIDSSLFLAGQAAGLSDNLIMELAGIFGWDIDFALDIRSGDHFSLVYEEQYLDGRKLGDGHILAAEFVNRGKAYRALRYTDANGHADYYSPDGKSMRKAFLRTPVDFTRISSRFGMRYHPMLKKRRNHHGVDYAAPIGTPIKAAGDGKVIFAARKGGYGKVVILQHGSTYSTLYAHMSRIRPGMRRGVHVRQGQTIGYVGSTGRSTGPHLHYEFRVNGVHRNPLTVRLPDAAPIQAKYRADFLNKSRGLVSLLDVLSRTAVALNEHSEGAN